METRADAIVPTTRAAYDPLNRIDTATKQVKSSMASPYLALSYFHLITAMLKKTAHPMMINSIPINCPSSMNTEYRFWITW